MGANGMQRNVRGTRRGEAIAIPRALLVLRTLYALQLVALIDRRERRGAAVVDAARTASRLRCRRRRRAREL